MASQTPDLLSEIKEGVGNWARTTLTGKPAPGSVEDYDQQLRIIQAQRALDEARRDPNDPRKLEALKQRFGLLRDFTLDSERQRMQMQADFMPTLIGAKGQLRQQETDQQTQLDRSQTDNTIRAQGGTKRDFLGDITSQELKLADYDAATTQQVLDFYRQAHDKNLAAQEAARKPSLMKTMSLLAVLGATADDLFG